MESAGAATLLTKLARRRLAKKNFSGKQDFRTWNQMDAMNENLVRSWVEMLRSYACFKTGLAIQAVRSLKQFANIFATKV